MSKKRIISLFLAFSLVLLVGCGGKTTKKNEENKDKKSAELSFALKTKDDKKAIDGGTLEVGVVSDTDFTGIFNNAFSKITLDTYFGSPAMEGLFNIDKDLRITDSEAAKIKFDTDAKTATITLNENLKWSDGENVTADDLIYPYEVISHKDYTGVRYTDDMENIVGVVDYHEGKSDTISGIEKTNDKEIVIHFKEFSPSILQSGGTILSYAIPKHAFKGIPVKDMESSDPVRKNPVTIGPYRFKKIIPGESVEFVPNEYYYGKKPKLDKVILTKVGTSAANEAMKAKKYDLFINMEKSTYETWKDNDSYQILGELDTAYEYLGFKLGKWDSEKGAVVTDPNAKMADKNLRQAMGYAINNKLISERFYSGLKVPANSLIVPAFGSLYDKEMKGYEQDTEKANKLLDEAGFKDVDNDGYREDKNGKKLTINLAFRDNAEVAKSIADYYIQEWKKVGLHVELTGGRLMEVNSFYDRLGADDPEIDVYQGGWSTGYDPNQSGLYGPYSKFNYTRFSADEHTKLLNRMSSSEALDETKQTEIYKEWQQYAFDQAFVIPTMYEYTLVPTHKRVVGYTVVRDYTVNPWATIGVTAETRE